MSSVERSASRHVAMLVDARGVYARELVRGIVRYASERAGWVTCDMSQTAGRRLAAQLTDWQTDGVLAGVDDSGVAKTILNSGIPAVDLRGTLLNAGFPTVRSDDEAVAQLAIEHLVNRGFRQLGYIAIPNDSCVPTTDAFARQFLAAAAAAEISASVFRVRSGEPASARQTRLTRWVASLPKPVGIVAGDDVHGVLALECCHRVGVAVPEMAAVLGIGNDDCLCSLSSPSLSSIDLNPQRIGYDAAGLLDRMIDGESVDARDVLVEPRGVVTRVSTDVLAAEDSTVTRAVEFIRRRACSRIGVNDVANHVKMSKTTLESRFNRVLGRTVYQEIRRVQIERVKELLVTTDAPLKQIAAQTGFCYEEYLMRVFRRVTGETMTQYRRRLK